MPIFYQNILLKFIELQWNLKITFIPPLSLCPAEKVSCESKTYKFLNVGVELSWWLNSQSEHALHASLEQKTGIYCHRGGWGLSWDLLSTYGISALLNSTFLCCFHYHTSCIKHIHILIQLLSLMLSQKEVLHAVTQITCCLDYTARKSSFASFADLHFANLPCHMKFYS